MKLTPKIQQAINLVSYLHAGQTRKSNQSTPYVSHLFSVAWILSNYTDQEEVIISGLLHDVLEDVPEYQEEELKRDFGESVLLIVKGVSEDKDPRVEIDKRKTWKSRKLKYLATLKQGSEESLLVCAADKLHNLQSLIDEYQKQGELLWQRFNTTKENSLWFYGEVIAILKKNLNNPIVLELELVYDRASEILL